MYIILYTIIKSTCKSIKIQIYMYILLFLYLQYYIFKFVVLTDICYHSDMLKIELALGKKLTIR